MFLEKKEKIICFFGGWIPFLGYVRLHQTFRPFYVLLLRIANRN